MNIIEKVQNAKLTTDLLNIAGEVMAAVEKAETTDELMKLEADRRYLRRNIEGQLESGAHVGQARLELKGAQYLVGTAYDEAKRTTIKRQVRTRYGI